MADEIPSASSVGMNADQLERISPMVNEAIERGEIPGCVVLVARQGQRVFLGTAGNRCEEPQVEPMTEDTVFDMASLTKPVATATSIMLLIQRGELRLDDALSMHLPELANNGKEQITVYQCLTHQAGFVPDSPLSEYADRDQIWPKLCALGTIHEPGSTFVYSDVGFQLLGKLVERVSGESLDAFARKNIFQPLGMRDTGFRPAEELHPRCAPTERREGRWMRGEVHDPRAYAMGGVAGHAGLFSTASDLQKYAQMMLNEGQLDGTRVLSPLTVRQMTRAFPSGIYLRGLGWDKRSKYSTNRSGLYSERAFGHGGFTGTAMWVDPAHQLIVIVLSNRLHPDGEGTVNRLAGRIGTVVAAAMTKDVGSSTTRHQTPQGERHRTLAGVDALQSRQFNALTGRKVGLITNHTGRNRAGLSTALLLKEAPTVDLVCLFSPEHGLAGSFDQSQIADAIDPSTGLPIYSLYGKNRSPQREHLRQIDTLVFDIQDIGTRFYTYISTMGNAMEAAAEEQVRFVVLDRPNPIGGSVVAGPVLDAGRESFVGFHTLPVRHGMTVGELAQMFRSERKQALDLEIVRVEGWSRSMGWDQTGLMWVNPSPNMRTPHQALLYPGIGLLETTNLSVGRGTDTPFEIVGAPWVEAVTLAEHLNQRGLGGVRFVPIEFTPTASKFKGERCRGVRFQIANQSTLQPLRLGLEVACALRDLFEDKWQMEKMDRLLCNADVLGRLKSGASPEQITGAYQAKLADFERRRESFLIYK